MPLAAHYRGTAVAWAYFNASAGFDALTLLDVGQNALNASLPAGLALLPSASALRLAVYDNLFSGAVPSAYTGLLWVALAYNPLLVGQLPAAFTKAKLWAWSAYYNAFAVSTNTLSSPTYGEAPTYGTGVLYGTSLGLDRPLVTILRDIQAALDPTGAALRTWGAAHWQPCPPWLSSNGAYISQNSSTPGYGRSWLGVACGEWDGLPMSATSQLGGAGLALLGAGLTGTVPVQLRELRTAATIALTRNLLTGSLPAAWYA
jgi:hypothetical protein